METRSSTLELQEAAILSEYHSSSLRSEQLNHAPQAINFSGMRNKFLESARVVTGAVQDFSC